MRKSRIEYKWSDLAQRADVTADMVNRQQRARSGSRRPLVKMCPEFVCEICLAFYPSDYWRLTTICLSFE
jgi:hypothetical protein